MFLRILVYLVIYDSGQVSLEHLLLSWSTTTLAQSIRAHPFGEPFRSKVDQFVPHTQHVSVRIDRATGKEEGSYLRLIELCITQL